MNIFGKLYCFSLTDSFLLHFILVANLFQGFSYDLKESVLKKLWFGVGRFILRNCFNSRLFLLFLHYILQFSCLSFVLLDYTLENIITESLCWYDFSFSDFASYYLITLIRWIWRSETINLMFVSLGQLLVSNSLDFICIEVSFTLFISYH